MTQVAIVVPTNRPEHALAFLKAWNFEYPVYLIEDAPERTFDAYPPHVRSTSAIPHTGQVVRHFSWLDIDEDLRDDSWIISRRNSGIRCYGFLKAVQDGADIIITLDDDCLPNDSEPSYTDYLVEGHLDVLRATFPRWVSTIESHYPARGMPYRNRGEMEVMLNMGGWTGVMDVDAMTELVSAGMVRNVPMRRLLPVPQGTFFPMCWMNLSFKRQMLPLMYAPLMGEDKNGNPWPFNRFDDIWCGVFLKKICDILGLAVTAGWPIVNHAKASSIWANLRKEVEGVIVNEYLWQWVDAFMPSKTDDLASAYCELAAQVEHSFSAIATKPEHQYYWRQLGTAMRVWTEAVTPHV